MMGNGVNNWSVSFAQISWLQQLLITHGNVAKVTRRDDIVFEVDRKRQADHLTVVCLNEYTMGLTAVHRVIHEFGKPGIIYVGGGWCGSSPRPFSVSQDEYDKRWDAIFGRDLKDEPQDLSEDTEQSEDEEDEALKCLRCGGVDTMYLAPNGLYMVCDQCGNAERALHDDDF